MVCVKRDKANISSIDINKSHDHFKDLFVSNVVDENVQDTVQFDISEESGAFFLMKKLQSWKFSKLSGSENVEKHVGYMELRLHCWKQEGMMWYVFLLGR